MLCYTLLVSGYAVFTSFLPLPAPNPPTHFPRFLPPPVHTYSSPGEGPLYLIEFFHWTPALGNEATLSHIKVEHVQSVVDGLDLLNLWQKKEIFAIDLDLEPTYRLRAGLATVKTPSTTTYLCLPSIDLLSNLLQLSEGVVFSCPQHTLKVIDAVGNSHSHCFTLWGCLRTLVQSGMESNKNYSTYYSKSVVWSMVYATYPSQIFMTLFLSCSPWKNKMNASLYCSCPCMVELIHDLPQYIVCTRYN